ncbi:hypothetical protein ACEN3Y_08890 [Latilactobacillus curvatus]|uniref:hypothetical protein n=1 Tax=Latilactobacillus curvatus TaxID=28038 RepID=UPI000230F13B|nr:hypothetical protein [Latilactobacillus curvatus]EHE85275.1 putative membrane protein [Latilactobacillus curvatus CRL 705]
MGLLLLWTAIAWLGFMSLELIIMFGGILMNKPIKCVDTLNKISIVLGLLTVVVLIIFIAAL